MSPLSPINATRLHLERLDWLADQRWTHAVTLSYNDWPITAARIRRDLRALYCAVERRLFGTRFHLRPTTARTRFVFLVEGMQHHPHLHGGWWVPGGQRIVDFAWTIREVWPRLAPAGTRKLRWMGDRRGWWSYCMKSAAPGSDWIISNEFLPSRPAATSTS